MSKCLRVCCKLCLKRGLQRGVQSSRAYSSLDLFPVNGIPTGRISSTLQHSRSIIDNKGLEIRPDLQVLQPSPRPPHLVSFRGSLKNKFWRNAYGYKPQAGSKPANFFVLRPQFKHTYLSVQYLKSPEKYLEMINIYNLLKSHDFDQALRQWRVLLSEVQAHVVKVIGSDLGKDLPIKGVTSQFLPKALFDVADELVSQVSDLILTPEQFHQFWAPVVQSSLSVELIPELIGEVVMTQNEESARALLYFFASDLFLARTPDESGNAADEMASSTISSTDSETSHLSSVMSSSTASTASSLSSFMSTSTSTSTASSLPSFMPISTASTASPLSSSTTSPTRSLPIPYCIGLNNGLNVLLHHHCRQIQRERTAKSQAGSKAQPDDITSDDTLFNIISGMNSHLDIYISRNIAENIPKVISRRSFGALCSLLLERNANLNDIGFNRLIKSLFCGTDLERQLILQADKTSISQGRRFRFNRTLYPFFIRELARDKDNSSLNWILLNVMMGGDNTLQQMKAQPPAMRFALSEIVNSAIYQSVESGDMKSAAILYDLMSDGGGGLKPNVTTLTYLFRGFKLHGMPDKCFEVLRMLNNKCSSKEFPANIRTDTLSLISLHYSANIVVEVFNLFYGSTLLSELGIINILEANRLTDDSLLNRPDFDFSDLVRPSIQYQPRQEDLNVVYNAVIATIGELKDIEALYLKYRQVMQESKPFTSVDMFVIDVLVDKLCTHFKTQRAVQLARSILTDALNNLNLKKTFSNGNKHRALPSLIHYYSLSGNVDAIMEILDLYNQYPFIPITGRAFNPIIHMFLKNRNIVEAKRWYQLAKQTGVRLTGFEDLDNDDYKEITVTE